MPLNPNDLRIETFRDAGAGPQTRPQMKRIIHIPTGLMVECYDYPRSETDKAIEKLEKMVDDLNNKGV
jgi:protein subunit release factor A